jgi:glutaredoxin 3
MPNIEIYTTAICPYCVAAARLLRDKKIAFREILLDGEDDPSAVVEKILPGHQTVPLILIDGKPIGGFTELQALAARGGVDPLVAG